jgi:hypothetical protein
MDLPPYSVNQNLLKNYHPSQSEICDIFKSIRKAEDSGQYKNIEQLVLFNGLTVGEFCMWYIVSNRTLCFPGGKSSKFQGNRSNQTRK